MSAKYHIAILDKKLHHRTDFDCGNPDLNLYLQEKARKEQQENIAVTYVLTELNSPRVLAYYTLSAKTINLQNIPAEIVKKLPKYPQLPATLIGRLAVDRKYHKQGLGKLLIYHAFQTTHNISKQIASYASIVDAKDNAAKAFYEKFKLISVLGSPKKMYLPMTFVAKLFA